MRKFLAGLAAAIFAFTPALASAQTIGYSPHTLPLSGSCGTVVLSTPCFDVTQTWNAGGVTFTGLRANITDTASAAGSLLLDLQVAGSSKFSVSKSGQVVAGLGVQVANNGAIGWTDTTLWRDAANTLALRNGVNPQTFRVANTWTDASNNENGLVGWVSNVFSLGTDFANGTGSARAVGFVMNGTRRWVIDTSGNFVAGADATYDIGQSGASRPRNIWLAGTLSSGGTITSNNGIFAAATGSLAWTGRAQITSPADGVIQPQTSAGSGAQMTVATLPSCVSGLKGSRAFVTDATATTFLSTVAGSGANNVPVVCDGTSWKIGQANLSPANDNLPPAYREQADRLWSAFG